MKKFIILYITIFICFFIYQAKAMEEPNNTYQYFLDLNNIIDNKIQVTLVPPIINKNETTFHFPRMVPGTYHVYDFGRFVSGLKAYDKDGYELMVSSVDSNSWNISAIGLSKITYFVEDSWHTKNPNNKIFEPVGLNLQENKNFVLNPPCIFGYFDDMKRNQFDITISKPAKFYGSTPLIAVYNDNKMDKYSVDSYYDLIDSPLMYDIPDTTIINVGDAKVLVSVYSPNHKIRSKVLAKDLRKILNGQRIYLGGKLPVKKYAYIYYFVPFEEKASGSFGALEHNKSSLYFLPEISESESKGFVLDASAHEFFHIITPLSVHSEEIQDFDYDNPKMSEHLWLYEGLTEYSAMICLVKEGIITRDDFLDKVKEKIVTANGFNDTLPFTEMSKYALDKYSNQYINVYQKGALIGMCLDLKLKSLSGGSFGVREMMNELSKRYGKDKAFKDDELFDVITSITYPEIRTFFAQYVEGSTPLPYKEFLNLAGIDYDKTKIVKAFTLGKIAFAGSSEDKYMEAVDVSKANEFGKAMGYKKGDRIKKINGIEAPVSEYKKIINSVLNKSKEGDILTVTVLRKDANGIEHELTLKSKMYKVEVNEENVIGFNPKASPEQIKLRDSWLGEN